MFTISLNRAKVRLDEVLDKLADAQDVVITRRGKQPIRLTAVLRPKKPLPLKELERFRTSMPRLRRPSAELIREMRDEGR